MEKLALILVTTVAGAGIGFLIPFIVDKIIIYKCGKTGKPLPKYGYSYLGRAIIIVISAALAALCADCVPPIQIIFYVLFATAAIIGTIIDNKLQIIPNELVLALLAVGLIYRLLVSDFKGLLDSLIALLIVFAIFAVAAAATKFISKNIGVGAGDMKLAAVAAFIVSLSGMFYFLIGLAVSIGIYCIGGLILKTLTPKSTFPMCGYIMAGFLIALYTPYFVK
ncbi:prepilin peptidase [[Clostridium] cellulosi]